MASKRSGPTHLKDELHPRARDIQWGIQRLIWLLMLVFLVLTVLGVFGSGVFSEATRSTGGKGVRAEIEYQRLARLKRPQRLLLSVSAPEARGELSVALSQEFARSIRIHGVIPDADFTALAPHEVTYEWTVDDWSEPVDVYWEFQAERWWRLEGYVIVTAGSAPPQRIEFSQFVYP